MIYIPYTYFDLSLKILFYVCVQEVDDPTYTASRSVSASEDTSLEAESDGVLDNDPKYKRKSVKSGTPIKSRNQFIHDCSIAAKEWLSCPDGVNSLTLRMFPVDACVAGIQRIAYSPSAMMKAVQLTCVLNGIDPTDTLLHMMATEPWRCTGRLADGSRCKKHSLPTTFMCGSHIDVKDEQDDMVYLKNIQRFSKKRKNA